MSEAGWEVRPLLREQADTLVLHLQDVLTDAWECRELARVNRLTALVAKAEERAARRAVAYEMLVVHGPVPVRPVFDFGGASRLWVRAFKNLQVGMTAYANTRLDEMIRGDR